MGTDNLDNAAGNGRHTQDDKLVADIDSIIRLRLKYSVEHPMDEKIEKTQERAEKKLDRLLSSVKCEKHIQEIGMRISHDIFRNAKRVNKLKKEHHA